MQALFYRFLIGISRYCGTWIFSISASAIAAVYFLMSPRRRAIGRRFYGNLFPDKTPRQIDHCTWKQFQSFTHVFLDRHLQRQGDPLQYTNAGRHHIEAAKKQGNGAILLMSHIGNWELAAHGLKKQHTDLNLMLLMGIRHKEAIEKIQKKTIHNEGIQIMGVEQEGGSPFDIIEAVHWLQAGNFISMTGDRLWRPDQRSVDVTFMGHHIKLPEAPYTLALVTGAPIIVFFAFRTGNRQYQTRAEAPIQIHAATRDQRQAAIRKGAQQYANLLEQAIILHPFEWFHFDDFLGPKM